MKNNFNEYKCIECFQWTECIKRKCNSESVLYPFSPYQKWRLKLNEIGET